MSVTPTLQGVPLAGLRLGAPLGSGAHGVVWAATTDGGAQVAVRVLPDVDPAEHTARARRLDVLRTLDHPGLARLPAMPEDTDERLLVTELVEGPSLATVRTGRMGLPAEEALTLAHDLADGLAVLHSRGLAHGDVSPGNVVMVSREDDDGAARPVLVDLAADLGWEAGTAGFSAPEVRIGRVAAPPSDVWALATLCVWVARAGEREVVARALGAALAEDPAARPSAAALAELLAGRASTPVRVPPPSVLAGAALRERAQHAPTVLRPLRRRRPRHRRPSRAPRVVMAAAVVSAAVVIWGLMTHDDAGDPGARGTAAVSAGLVASVADLVALRDEALVEADADALAAVSAEGSEARQDDAALLASLTSQGVALDGLRTEVAETEVLHAAATGADVRTWLTQAEHVRITGTAVERVPAQPPRCVELSLQREDGRWVVASVRGCP